MLLLAMSTPTNPIKAVLGLLQVAFARRYPERNIVIESVINAKNELESCHSNKRCPIVYGFYQTTSFSLKDY